MLYRITSIYASRDYDEKRFKFWIQTGKDLDDYISQQSNDQMPADEIEHFEFHHHPESDDIDEAIKIQLGYENDDEAQKYEYTFYPSFKYKPNDEYKSVIEKILNEIYKRYEGKEDELKRFVERFDGLPQAQKYKRILNRSLDESDIYMRDIIDTFVKHKDKTIVEYFVYGYEPKHGEPPHVFDYENDKRILKLISQASKSDIPKYMRFTKRRHDVLKQLRQISPYFAYLIYNDITWIYLNFVWYENGLKDIYIDTVKFYIFLSSLFSRFNLEYATTYILLKQNTDEELICKLLKEYDSALQKTIGYKSYRIYLPKEFEIYIALEDTSSAFKTVSSVSDLVSDDVIKKVMKSKSKDGLIIPQKALKDILKVKRIECINKFDDQ